MTWRYFVTRPNLNGTETLLHDDLDLSAAKVVKTLSGPDQITGTIAPEMLGLLAPDGRPVLETWGACLYAEQDGVIRAGTILRDTKDSGPSRQIAGAGFSSYPQGQAFTGTTTHYRNADPAAICTAIWAHLQSQPGGNLGLVTAFGATPVRTGALTVEEAVQPRDGATGRYLEDSTPRAYTLSWETTKDLGRELDVFAEQTPFDYVEDHQWSGSTIKHTLRSTYPRIGRRRNDLRFVEGENIYSTPDVIALGDDYASEVLVVGAGEGSKRIRSTSARGGEKRLRRAVAVDDLTLRTKAEADARARVEVAAHLGRPVVQDIAIVDHPHAPIGSISLGDEVLYEMGPTGWQAGLSQWVRVVQITYQPEVPEGLVLKVAPVI